MRSQSHELHDLSRSPSQWSTTEEASNAAHHDGPDAPSQQREYGYQSLQNLGEVGHGRRRQTFSNMYRLPGPWIWEILAWVLAAISLAILIIVLALFNQKPLSHWHSGVSVNTLINVLTTISSLALIFPVASGIAQMKWLWLQHAKRPLAGIESFGAGPIEVFNMLRKHPKMWAPISQVIFHDDTDAKQASRVPRNFQRCINHSIQSNHPRDSEPANSTEYVGRAERFDCNNTSLCHCQPSGPPHL